MILPRLTPVVRYIGENWKLLQKAYVLILELLDFGLLLFYLICTPDSRQ